MSEFIKEQVSVDEESKGNLLPLGMLQIGTLDAKNVHVNKAVWLCYFPENCIKLELLQPAAQLLIKLM